MNESNDKTNDILLNLEFELDHEKLLKKIFKNRVDTYEDEIKLRL